MMQKKNDLQEYFKTHKSDFPDNGFSDEVMRRLPRRSNFLPRIIILFSLVLGGVATVLVLDVEPMLKPLFEFAGSIAELRIPSASSLMSYLLGLLMVGSIGFALYRTEAV